MPRSDYVHKLVRSSEKTDEYEVYRKGEKVGFVFKLHREEQRPYKELAWLSSHSARYYSTLREAIDAIVDYVDQKGDRWPPI